MYSRGGSLTNEVLSDLAGRPVVVALDEPMVVVVEAEFLERLVEVVEIGEGADPEELLLQGAPEGLDTAVALGARTKDGLVGPGDELGAIVVTQFQAGGVGHSDAAEPEPPPGQDPNDNWVYSSQAWVYNPETKTFTSTGNLHIARGFHHAVLMDDGRVLIAGGSARWIDNWWDKNWPQDPEPVPWARNFPFAEIFDPVSGSFEALPAQNYPNVNSTLTQAHGPLQGAGMMASNHPWGHPSNLPVGKSLSLVEMGRVG